VLEIATVTAKNVLKNNIAIARPFSATAVVPIASAGCVEAKGSDKTLEKCVP